MMKPVFLLKSKSVVGEKVQHHDQTKQSKRKIVQQTNVEEQVSKIAKIFGNRGKQLLEVRQSLEHFNKRMVTAVIATTEELQKNEFFSSRINMMKSFLDESRGGGRKDKEIDDDIDSLKSSLNKLTASRSFHGDLISSNSTEVRIVHALIEKNSHSAKEIRSASSNAAALVGRLKALTLSKSKHMHSLREKKEKLKLETIEVMNSKKNLDDKLQVAKSSRNDYAEQVVGFRATAEQNENELKEFDEKLEELSDRMTERDKLGADATELEESLIKLGNDIKEKQSGQDANAAAVKHLEASVKQKSIADKSASAELSRLGTQQQELEQAVDDAKGTVLTLQKENVKRHDEYHSQLQALKATTHAHRQDLDEQTGALEAFQRESERLRESKQAACETLALLSTSLARENGVCAALQEECERMEKEVKDAEVELEGGVRTLQSLKNRGKELCTQMAATKQKGAAALYADVDSLVREEERKHAELELRLRDVTAQADDSSAYLQRLDEVCSPADMEGALSEATREQCNRSTSEYIASTLQGLAHTFAENEKAKTAILEDLRSDKKFKQKEERQRDKVLEWKDKLGALNERISNLRAGTTATGGADGGKTKSKGKSGSAPAWSSAQNSGGVKSRLLSLSTTANTSYFGPTGFHASESHGVGTATSARARSALLVPTSGTGADAGAGAGAARGLTLAVDTDRESGFASPTAFIKSKRKAGKSKGKAGGGKGGGTVVVTQKAQSLSFAGDWFDDLGSGW
jgi:hypothetical protein